ncbi:glutamate--tRNA ligase [Candidatus Micrarchaeota archaeon CG10_big_fil_rev_8_21_14_0_10_45_29]|nr:MAG: glutamate--tRNA ligase [Candidatus Micrarchaeota archaeon CG10_big_fil_rev_8_21_14_0_10_45_29]
MEKEIEETIKKWALKNAHDYGKADAGKVMGRAIAAFPEERKNAKGLMQMAREECERVNSLEKKEIEKEMLEFTYEEKQKEEEKGISLPDAVEGKVVTRFPPEPSGYLHIGHAKAVFLNYEGANAHKGHMRLRFDETNPAKSSQKFVDAIMEDLKWLGVKWKGQVTYSSDYMDEFYKLANEMIMLGKAYVCTCAPEKIKAGRESGERCVCAAKDVGENGADFSKMRGGDIEEGGAILRFKGDMKDENTVMRDPTLFRIVAGEHFRQGRKYSCWPSYDFAAPILDSLEGVSHAMRSKEYELRDKLYFEILKILEMREPKLISFSRLAIKGAPVSKRLIRPLIEEGKVSGYDDPRLPTLSALRRRGILPEAIRKFVLSFGLSKVESEPGWEKLLSENRKLIDADAPRRFFVAEPARIKIDGVSAGEIEIKNHPQNDGLGKRAVQTSSVAYISGSDADALQEGEVFRLKDWCNLKLVSKEEARGILPSGEEGAVRTLLCNFASDEGKVEKKVQWVSDVAKIPAKVLKGGDLLIDGKYNENSLQEIWGWCERECAKMAEGQACQFERFGFVTLDKSGDVLRFIYISN